MKPAAIIGLLVIFSALAFGAKAFVTNLTPYVPFAEARKSTTNNVQIMGPLDKKSVRSSPEGLTFDILDKENPQDRMTITFKQAKPANFELAIEVTAIGRYQGNNQFHADKLLVKCPSKYEGVETKEYGAK